MRSSRRGVLRAAFALLAVAALAGVAIAFWPRAPRVPSAAVSASTPAVAPITTTLARPAPAPADPGGQRPVTFNRDLAAIVHHHCAGCHRPGEVGPFPLITVDDVRKHARDLIQVTRTRTMPPWMPAPGEFPFVDERRLSETQIQLFAQWLEDGLLEGPPAQPPPTPKWTEGWQLGPPDLIVSLPDSYSLTNSGPDVYRNFILPVPEGPRRFVRAFEFRPGSRAVHHAFIRIDGSGESRRLDQKDAEPGFGGMEIPPASESPAGHFLSWQPGRLPSVMPDGLAWPLRGGVDIVLLMHLQPLGRPEPLHPTLGFYFTEVAPTNMPIKLGLRSYTIDIPAGTTNNSVEERVTLPVDTRLLAVLPHAHYLASQADAFALLPDGSRKSLMHIPRWDFNWQSEFRFVTPVSLPRGTVLGMRFTFDNSSANPRNPRHPPQRTTFGLQTSDEMAELWFQLLPVHAAEAEQLERTAQSVTVRDIAELSRFRLRQNPSDPEATAELGKALLAQGDLDGAESHFRQALQLRPTLDDAHYHLGLVLYERRRFADAERAFLESLRLNPAHFQARNNAGLCCLQLRRPAEAAAHFREVLRVRPEDRVARANLQLVERR
ncbi:MAG: tetratricopeptide repeat protein [Verrucomicrobiales bacterium]|nr:tetratricopeptide repeat protein [Verrucomicrobiales bacterium]